MLLGTFMFINMVLARLGGGLVSMRRMPLSRVCVVSRRYVISGLSLFRSFPVVPSRMLVMFCGAMMVFGGRMRMVHLILSQFAKRTPQT